MRRLIVLAFVASMLGCNRGTPTIATNPPVEPIVTPLVVTPPNVPATQPQPSPEPSAEIEKFVGRWRIVDEKGATAFFLTLGKSHDALKSHVPNATGTWEIVGSEVRVTWSDGWRDILRPQFDGVFKIAFKPGTSWNDTPFHTQRAIKGGLETETAGKKEVLDKAAARVADLKAMLLTAQQEEEQAKKRATEARAEADKATQRADQDNRANRAAQAAADRLGGDAVRAGSADAQSRIQAYKDVLETSGRAAKSAEEAKQLVEKAKKAEAKVKQATIAVSEARADLRQAESDLLKAQLAPQ